MKARLLLMASAIVCITIVGSCGRTGGDEAGPRGEPTRRSTSPTTRVRAQLLAYRATAGARVLEVAYAGSGSDRFAGTRVGLREEDVMLAVILRRPVREITFD